MHHPISWCPSFSPFFLTPSFSNFFFSILNPLFSTPQVQSIHFKKDLKNEGKIKRERSAWWEVGGGPGCPDPIDQIICTVKLPKHPWVTSLPQACVSCFFLFFSSLWSDTVGPAPFSGLPSRKHHRLVQLFFFHFLSSKFLIFFWERLNKRYRYTYGGDAWWPLEFGEGTVNLIMLMHMHLFFFPFFFRVRVVTCFQAARGCGSVWLVG